MSKQVGTPKFFDSLHTLNVWTPYARMMRGIYEALNGNMPYINANMVILPGINRVYTPKDLFAFLAENADTIRINFDTKRQQNTMFVGRIQGINHATETAFVLTLEGWLVRDDYRAQASVACFYETGDFGCNYRGFGLIPELAMRQLGHNT